MKSWGIKILFLTVFFSGFLFLTQLASLQADTLALARIRLVNDTSVMLKFFVNGTHKCNAAAGGHCDDLEKPGQQYNLRAEAMQGPGSISTTITLEAGGFTWTIYEEE